MLHAALGAPRRRTPASCEAEIVALSECVKDVVYFRKLIAGIDPKYITGPTSTSTDNKGAHDLSYNPEFHNKTKHIARRHFYVRDMVEALEVVVPLVKTDDNAADFFTKPLDKDKFFSFRDVLMNISPFDRGHSAALAVARHRRGVSFSQEPEFFTVPAMSPRDRATESARIKSAVAASNAEVAALGGRRRAVDLAMDLATHGYDGTREWPAPPWELP